MSKDELKIMKDTRAVRSEEVWRRAFRFFFFFQRNSDMQRPKVRGIIEGPETQRGDVGRQWGVHKSGGEPRLGF